jgi:hypothetical protein
MNKKYHKPQVFDLSFDLFKKSECEQLKKKKFLTGHASTSDASACLTSVCVTVSDF